MGQLLEAGTTGLSDVSTMLSSELPWHVYHLRSRTEKVVEQRILRDRFCGLTSFLPTSSRSKRYQRRLVTTRLPLFPGYLFIRGDQGDAAEFASRTKEVVSCLTVHSQDRFRESMAAVFKMSEFGGEDVRPEPTLTNGAEVEIISGPLVGLRGRVVGELKSLRFIVAVDILQRGASVEVDEAMIERV